MAPRPSLPSSAKKRKQSDSISEENVAARIQLLEQRLIESVAAKSSLNPLADLLDIAHNTPDAQVLSKAIWALYRVYVVVIKNGALLNVAGSDEARAVRAWLQEKLNGYVKLLVGLMKDEETVLRVRSLFIDEFLH